MPKNFAGLCSIGKSSGFVSRRMMVDTIQINAMNLYSLSNFEKGRLCSSKPISPWEKKRLKASVEMMSMILCGLECKDFPVEKINTFIDANRGKIFPIDCDYCETNVCMDYSEKQREVLELMSSLLFNMKSILSKARIQKNELQELSYLLHAFHNLPRALFSCSSKLYMSSDDAVQYANEWIFRMNKPCDK